MAFALAKLSRSRAVPPPELWTPSLNSTMAWPCGRSSSNAPSIAAARLVTSVWAAKGLMRTSYSSSMADMIRAANPSATSRRVRPLTASGVDMLADRSTQTVKSGFPAGGGIRSNHVGFNRTSNGSVTAIAIRPITIGRRRPGSRPRAATAYHPSSVAAASANGTQRASGTYGSKVRCLIRSSPKG